MVLCLQFGCVFLISGFRGFGTMGKEIEVFSDGVFFFQLGFLGVELIRGRVVVGLDFSGSWC